MRGFARSGRPRDTTSPIHHAKDLSPDQKLLLENLLGPRVLEAEAISVRAFEPLALSSEILHEVAKVLRYPRLQEFYGLSEVQVYEFIGYCWKSRRSSRSIPFSPFPPAMLPTLWCFRLQY